MPISKIPGKGTQDLFNNISDQGTEGTKVATGTTAQRGSTQGQLRFNTTTNLAEYYTVQSLKLLIVHQQFQALMTQKLIVQEVVIKP